MSKRSKSKTIGEAALRCAIEARGLTNLARDIGVPYQIVQGWLVAGRRFASPAEHCPSIERVTGVRCEQLRPDVDWATVRRNAFAPAAEIEQARG